MELLSNLLLGLQTVVSPINLMYCALGVTIGTLIGVLPGIGPIATMAMLLPITYKVSATASLILLAGIYYGAMYGGSTTSILVNLPGEAASVVTCLDGYVMAREGRAGPALSIAAIGSFAAGCFATLMIVIFGPPLAEVALKFGPAEYFSMMVLGLIAAVILAHGSVVKAIGMVLLGLLFGIVGIDVNSGTQRFTFGMSELSDGLSFIVVAMGFFAFGEIASNLESQQKGQKRDVLRAKIQRYLPSKSEFKASWKPIIRGSLLGSMLGLLPGGGAIISSFASYTLEKRLAKDPTRFGRGAIEGVAGPEAANNAGSQISFIPLLTLGIPSNAVMAIMLGAMQIQGITSGPQVMVEYPSLFWGLIVSMWIGNFMLVILNLPLIGVWIKLLKVPYRFLFPSILSFCCIGIYCINNSAFETAATAVFGILGHICNKLDCEPAPLILGLILGPMMEEYFRRALSMSNGNPMIFVTQPISLVLLLMAVLLLAMMIMPTMRLKREKTFNG